MKPGRTTACFFTSGTLKTSAERARHLAPRPQLIERDFGNLDNFKAQLLAGGKVAPIGWSVWAYSMLDQKTHVYVVEQH